MLFRSNNNEDSDTEKTGFLPKMINVDEEELKSEDFNEIITDRFVPVRGIYHFIFLTSTTDTFSDFETNFYSDNLTEMDRKKMLFGIVKQQKVDKELNQQLYEKMSAKDKCKLKEYDNMKKLLECLLENNYPYISYIYGGFESIHEEIQEYNKDIVLLNHDANCELCLKRRRKNSTWITHKIKQVVKQSKNLYDNISTNLTNNINTIVNKEKDKNKVNIKKYNSGKIGNFTTDLNEEEKRRNSVKTKKSHLTKKYMTLSEVTELITNNEYNSKSCSLMKYNDKEYTKDNQGVIVIQKYALLMLKFTNEMQDKMEIIDKFQLKLITDVKIANKFYANIYYAIDNEKNSLAIKFEKEQDTKNFFYELTQARKIFKK